MTVAVLVFLGRLSTIAVPVVLDISHRRPPTDRHL
jgi:hypothetical protein